MTSPLYRQAAPRPTEDEASRTLRSRVERRLEVAQRLHEKQAAILVAMRRSLDALKKVPDGVYTEQWLWDRQQAIRAQARKALDQAEEAAIESIEEGRAIATEATKHEPASYAEASLFEQRKQGAWASVRQILESASMQSDPLAALQDACESAGRDPVKLAAIREYGPDWVTSHFGHVGATSRKNIQQALDAGLDAVEGPTWSPSERAARELLMEIGQGQQRLQQSTHEVRREVEGRGAPAGALVSWDGTVLPLMQRQGALTGLGRRSVSTEALPAEEVVASLGAEARAWTIAAAKNYPLLTEEGATRPDGLTGRNAREADSYYRQGLPFPDSLKR